MAIQLDTPPFFDVIIRDDQSSPGLLGVCAGFERDEWRYSQLAHHLMEWLPEFCLNFSEFESITGANAAQRLRRAAARVYESKKFTNRGEFGELILHAILRQEFGTLPAISKIFYKDSANDTVKGFDAVHVVEQGGELQLWLGEAKFYEDANAAISAAAKELALHTQSDYLRSEFVAIENKIDPHWPHAKALKRLLHENTSLDEVFNRLCVPVLITYDSPITSKFTSHCEEYVTAISEEYRAHYDRFSGEPLPPVTIYLFLLPLATKKKLVAVLDEVLKAWQKI